MIRVGCVLVLSASLSGAPFQCTSEPDPANAIEETPGQALYELAEEFKKDGKTKAWRDTLEHLIEHYPASRFASAARRDLGKSAPGDVDAKPDRSKTAATPK